ncbi:MAG: site-specific integrase [Sphingomonadales bacterium]|nr:site-specific integrase [Sphingomonadales bacterium]
MPWTVYNNDGQRKYLTKTEIDSFLKTARNHGGAVYGFCWMMAVTGCRISEALSLNENSIDFEAKQVIILCLKKRTRRVFRAIPLPDDLLRSLEIWMNNGVLPRGKFWPWSRMTAYRRVCEIMRETGLKASYATPKGLRHGFAVRAIQSNVPLNLVQRWLGHADIKMTAIYASAMGPEERELASRLWSGRQQRVSDSGSEGQSGRKRSVAHSRKLLPGGPGQERVSAPPAPPSAPVSRHSSTTWPDSALEERGAHKVTKWPDVQTTLRQSYQFGPNPSCCLLHFWLKCHT